MPFSPVARSAILFPTPPSGNHLFVILTDPLPPHGEVAMVPVCSVRNGHDNACVLYPGDHPFIRHKSYIAYARGRVERDTRLIRGVERGLTVDKGRIAHDVFDRILAGSRVSRHVKPFLTEFLDLAT